METNKILETLNNSKKLLTKQHSQLIECLEIIEHYQNRCFELEKTLQEKTNIIRNLIKSN